MGSDMIGHDPLADAFNRSVAARVASATSVIEAKMNVLANQLRDSRAQIEYMKCCGNCKSWNSGTNWCNSNSIKYHGDETCIQWELAE